MTRMLLIAGAAALVAATIGGPASAEALMDRMAPDVQAPVSAQPMNWHYEWQYQFDSYGQYVPGWVAVPNSAQ